jgi:RNase P subunit RPR2
LKTEFVTFDEIKEHFCAICEIPLTLAFQRKGLNIDRQKVQNIICLRCGAVYNGDFEMIDWEYNLRTNGAGEG